MKPLINFLTAAAALFGTSAQAEFRGAFVHKGGDSDQITAGSYKKTILTPVTFGTVEYDTHGFFDGTDTFVIPVGVSMVRLQCQLVFEHNGRGFRQASIRKNGDMYPGYPSDNRPAVSGTNTDINVTSPIIPVKAGDRFQCEAWHSINEATPRLKIMGLDAVWFALEVIRCR